MTSQDELKKAVAWKAITYIKQDMVVGVGSGSTVAYFIEALATIRERVKSVVSSSIDTTQKLNAVGFSVVESNSVDGIDVYIDGADEINPLKQMIKGGGAALTQEKILAAMARTFVCIVDSSKQVPQLGSFPLPIEVIPMARSYVARELVKLGGRPVYRQGVATDNSNVILDIHNLKIATPLELEQKINNIAGVVTVGLFALRSADSVIVAREGGIITL